MLPQRDTRHPLSFVYFQICYMSIALKVAMSKLRSQKDLSGSPNIRSCIVAIVWLL